MITLQRLRLSSLPRALALAAVLGLAAPAVDLVIPDLPVAALAAGGSADGHKAGGPWDDDNHNGVANFFDGTDEHHASSWGHPVYLQWIWHLFNLLVLLGVLFWAGRKGIGAFLRDRALSIKTDLEQADAVQLDATARYQELESRLAGFEDEVASIKAEAERAAKAERALAEQRAHEAAARIRDAAERAIRDETHRATRVLRAEAVQLAVELAERTLKAQVDDSDRQRLAADLLASLRADGADHG